MSASNSVAFTLLTERKVVLLEPTREAEPDVAFTPRIRAQVQRVAPGRAVLLHVSVPPSRWAAPAAGSEAALLVPVSARLWRFPSRVLDVRGSEQAVQLLVEWPAEASQEAGRRAPRVQANTPVHVLAMDDGPIRRPISTYSLDISTSGVQFLCPVDLAAGSVVPLRLRLGSASAEPLAQVAWVRPFHTEPGDPLHRIGAEFIEMSPADQQRVATYVRRADARAGA